MDHVRIYRDPETSEVEPNDCCNSLLEALDQPVSIDAEIIDNGMVLAFASATRWRLSSHGVAQLQREIGEADDHGVWLKIVCEKVRT